MNRYRVLLPVLINGEYTQGDEFDHEFDAADEEANLNSGLLEIVPREYRNIGGSVVHGVSPGETFTAALKVGEESALVAGGHIERVEETPKKTRKGKEE